MHDNLIMSYKEEQKQTEQKIEDFKRLIANYIYILHQGQKLTKAFELSVKISNHFFETYDKLKDKVEAFIEKNKRQMNNPNSKVLVN